MSQRVRTSRSVELQLLLRSRRRCALCFGLHGDVSVKVGQIAHLDGNPANSALSNQVWLCLPHHDQYDGATSQSKGITLSELRSYRAKLYDFLEKLGDAWPGHLSEATAVASDSADQVPRLLTSVSPEIFDRRLVIYRLVRGYIGDIIANANVDLARLKKFSQDTEEALFLFGHDVDALLRSLYLQGVALKHINQVSVLATKPEDRERMHAEWDKIMTWFLDQFEVVRATFKRYMNL